MSAASLAAPPAAIQKTSWADDVDDDEFGALPSALPKADATLPERTETTDPATGIKTIVEYRIDEQGRKIKTTRQIRLVLSRQLVSHAAASRKQLPKFGLEKGKPLGTPDSATTTLGEAFRITLRAGGAKNEPEVDESAAMREKLVNKTITCRICQGAHYTTRCPYRDTLGGVLGDGEGGGDIGEDTPAGGRSGAGGLGTPAPEPAGGAGGGGAGGKYVPPSLRAGAAGRGRGGETMNSRRDDLPTLRVANLSEDTREEDVWDLFSRFGRVTRVYVGMDQDTGVCKGFSFVTFEEQKAAEAAVKKINGMPYDHLILSCSFSAPRGERPAPEAGSGRGG